MNIIYVTMGSSYNPFYDVYLRNKHIFKNTGFYVSDKFFFNKQNKFDDSISYLKEWTITEKLSTVELNIDLISELENKYFSDESVWNCLNIDRRIFLGKYVKNTQNYKPSYEYEELLKLFQEFANNIERFFDEIKPSVLVGLSPSTIGEYLFVKIANQKKIPFHILRSSKLKNYQTFTLSMFEEYSNIKASYSGFSSLEDIDQKIIIEAQDYLLSFSDGNLPYEGNVKTLKKFKIFKLVYFVNFFKFLFKDLLMINQKRDHHNRELFSLKYLFDNPIRNYRIRSQKRVFKNRTIHKLSTIKKKKYIFFPLHAEPEISIANFSRRYQNQIEVIRNIALQMPSEYKLLVKEHPRNIGRRKSGYYKKILSIPNVDFADYMLPSLMVVNASKLVIVLSGNIGFEAIMSKVPVISLSNTMYNMLPKNMINHLKTINNLHHEIIHTIESYNYSEEELIKYLSAILSNSFPLDLYTVLLSKEGREGGMDANEQNYKKNIEALSLKIRQLAKSDIQ
jgi:hypothetical protein